MPLDDLQQYGRNSSSSSDSGESDDDANCSQPKADGNATDSESGEDGDQAQQSDEQSENGEDDSSEHTPAQKSKRAPFTQLSADEPPDLVDESDDEDRAEETDEETLAAHYKIQRGDAPIQSTSNFRFSRSVHFDFIQCHLFPVLQYFADRIVVQGYNSRVVDEETGEPMQSSVIYDCPWANRCACVVLFRVIKSPGEVHCFDLLLVFCRTFSRYSLSTFVRQISCRYETKLQSSSMFVACCW